LIDPPLLQLVGDVRGKRVLDLAYSNGYLSRRFARQGTAVTGIDANASIIERAREARDPLGITYHVADAAHLTMLLDGAFDVVVCNMALMDSRTPQAPSRRSPACSCHGDGWWRASPIRASIR
jgi:2-polyprenyl-3-methyl-5-hydroxy-6-metoxy-1,4-benzoquinol methylase